VPQIASGGNELYDIIASGRIIDYDNNPTTIYTLQRSLFQQLKNDPMLLATSREYGSFLSTNVNNNVGKFALIENRASEAFKADQAMLETSEEYKNQLKTFIDKILELDSSFKNTGDSSKLIEFFTQRTALLNEIQKTNQLWGELQHTYRKNIGSAIQDEIQLNKNIQTTAIYEDNEKLVNQVYLTLVSEYERDTLTSKEIELLKSIAIQCPKYGGMAVYEARGLLPVTLQLEYNDNRADCYPIPEESEELVESNLQISLSIQSTIKIYPNPPVDQLNVIYPSDKTGFLTITDIKGSTLLKTELDSSGSFTTKISNSLVSGLYFCTINLSDGTVYTKKTYYKID